MLREDIKHAIENEFGKRQLSKLINNLLFEKFISKNKDMFGIDKWLTKTKIKEVREHHNRF